MVLIYYAQVSCRWLPFTDNKGKNVANYLKEKDVADRGESGWTDHTPYLGGLAQIFGSYFRNMQQPFTASIQGEGVLAKASLIAA